MVSLIVDGEPVLKGYAKQPEAWPTESGLLRADPYCQQVADLGKPLAIPDVQEQQNDRSTGPFEAGIAKPNGAYLGIPLFAPDGDLWGVLCALEPNPRPWSSHELELLSDLAASLATEVGLIREPEQPRAGAETAIVPSEPPWQALIDAMPDLAWIARSDGRLEAFNYRWSEFTGLGRTESLDGGWIQAIAPNDRQRCLEAWQHAIDTGQSYELPCRFLAADGSERWFLLRMSAWVGAHGRVEAWLGSATDIQSLKESELELRHQSELIETLTKTATEGLCLLDLQGRLTFINPAVEHILGWSASELVMKRLEDLVLPNSGKPPFHNPEQWPPRSVLETAVIVRDREGQWYRKDGQTITVSYSCSPLLREGKLVGAVLAMGDITERKHSSQALLINRERLDLVIRTTELGLWYCDLPCGRLRWNAKCKEHFGLPQEAQVTIDTFYEWLHPDDRERSRQAVARAIETKMPYDIEYRTIGLDGRQRWIRAIGKAFHDASGNPLRFDGITVDTTEQKQAERALQVAKETAESASRAKDQFLAALSHELRTPLTPVLVSVTAMLEDPETPASVRPTLEITRRNIALEARLIDDLLDMTRISQGKLRLHRELVDAHEMAERALEICRDEIGTAGLELELNLQAASHHVDADPARLQQMIWNLIKNAVKFTPKRGLIRVQTRNETLSGGASNAPNWVIEVSDTGIGIEIDVLPKIFNAFEQGDPTITQQFGGLGMGLAISRSLAEAHNGCLSAWSAGRNQGATFTLRLPSITVSAKMPEPPPPTDPGASKSLSALRLLLVEDNADTLRVMTRLLRARGYHVIPADCVASALQADGVFGPFDLIVSDIGLPDGSGLDVIRQIRTTHAVPGIALSGFGTEEDLRKSGEAGFVTHLTKPVDFPTLDAAIRRVARARNFAEPTSSS